MKDARSASPNPDTNPDTNPDQVQFGPPLLIGLALTLAIALTCTLVLVLTPTLHHRIARDISFSELSHAHYTIYLNLTPNLLNLTIHTNP